MPIIVTLIAFDLNYSKFSERCPTHFLRTAATLPPVYPPPSAIDFLSRLSALLQRKTLL